MDSEFDRAIAVTAAAEGEYAASFDDGWLIGGALNGGFLLATMGSALRAAAPEHPDPYAISAHYVSASRPGPATISTRPVRRGRGSSTFEATLSQDGDVRISALATMGDLRRMNDEVATSATEPDLPPRSECVPADASRTDPQHAVPLMDRFEMLLDPACVGWALGKPSGRGVIQSWFRLVDGRDLDSLALLLVVDALPPVSFDLGRFGWAPTMQLSAHVRAQPAPGWCKVRTQTRNVAGGFFEEDCEVWDSAGRLVAQSRQLAKIPLPE